MAPTIRTGIPPGKPKLLDQVRVVIRTSRGTFSPERTVCPQEWSGSQEEQDVGWPESGSGPPERR
jgi:hypothetical protein